MDQASGGQTAELAGVVLAAGAGRRLSPLTTIRPKPLCPVGGVALVDLALARVTPVVRTVAVNVHHGRAQIEAHLAELERHARPSATPIHISIERDEALGTAGALGALRPWIDGRGVLVHNADAWAPVDLAPFVAGWDGERVRVLATAEFGPSVGLVATLLPWSEVVGLGAVPSGLYETTLRAAAEQARLDVVIWAGPFVDCGTPRDYLDANLAAVAAAGGSIVDGTASTPRLDRVVGRRCRRGCRGLDPPVCAVGGRRGRARRVAQRRDPRSRSERCRRSAGLMPTGVGPPRACGGECTARS